MAISPMKKITLSASSEYLDDLLIYIQDQEKLELVNLNKGSEPDSDRHQSYNNKLNQLEGRLDEIEHSINLLSEYVGEPSFIDKLKNGLPRISSREMAKRGRSFPEKESVQKVQDQVDHLQELEELIENLSEEYDKLYKWRNLTITPNELAEFSYVRGVIGLVPITEGDQFMSLIKDREDLEVQTIFSNELDSGVIVFSKDPDNTKLLDELKASQFVPFDYQYDEKPAVRLEELDQNIKALKEEKKEIEKELKSSGKLMDDLKIQYEYVNNKYIHEASKINISFSRNKEIFSILAWLEEANEEEFIEGLKARFKGNVKYEIHELTESDTKEAPTKLVNKKFVKPFELLVNMYGVPEYDEIDPTPYVMPFYSLFFGMMLADLGYGLLLFILTAIPLKVFDLSEGVENMLRLANVLSWFTMLWGAVYGGFFGFTIEAIQLIDIQSQTLEVMVISVIIGIVHLLIAFGINVYLETKRKRYALAYAEGLSWFLIISGLILMVLGNVFPAVSFLSKVGGWMAVICLIGIFIAYCINAKSLVGLGNGLLALIDGVSYFGDVISYTRLMALGLSGSSIGAAFNIIVGGLPPKARFTIGIVVFLFLHLLNMFLSVLTGVVHSLRLIFVEFFGKFYSGQGRLFKPLKMEGKYTRIISENVSEGEK